MKTESEIISEFGIPPICECSKCQISCRRYKIIPYKYSSYKKNGRYPKFIKGHQNRNKIHSEKQNKEHSEIMTGKMVGTAHPQYVPEIHKTLEEIISEFGEIPYCQCDSNEGKGCGLKVNVDPKYYYKYKKEGYPKFLSNHSCVGKNNPFFGKYHNSESKIKNSETHKELYKFHPEKILKGEDAPWFGKFGEESAHWKGGITPLYIQIRACDKYNVWRNSVFNRDNFTCQECGQIGSWLEAHHIKEFINIMKENNITTLDQALNCIELWNLNNGITLCRECHIKTF